MDDINSNSSNHNSNNNNNNNNKEQILLPSIKKPKPDTTQSEQRQMMATTATNAITTTTTTMTSNHNNPHSRQQQQQQHSDYAAAKTIYPEYQQQSTRVYKSNMQQWTNEEHIILIQGCYMYGDKDGRISWKDIIPMLQQQANKRAATDTDNTDATTTDTTTTTTNSSNNYKTKTYTDRCIKNRWHNKIKKLILKYRYNNNDDDYDINNTIKIPIKNPTRLDMALYLKQVLHTNIDDPAYHTTTPAAATASSSSTSVPFLRYGHNNIDATINTNFRTTLGTSNGNTTTTNVVANKARAAKTKRRNLLEKKQKYRRNKNKNKNSKWTKEEDEHIIQRVKEMQKSESSISWVQIVQSLNKPGIITNTHVKNRWNSRLKDLQLTKNDNNDDNDDDDDDDDDNDDDDDMNEAMDDDDDDDDDNGSDTMDDDGDDDENVKQGTYIPYANPYDNNSVVDDDNHSSNKSSSSRSSSNDNDNDNNRNKNGNNSSRSPTKEAKSKPKSKRWTFEEDKCILESIIHLQGLKQKWKMVAKHPMFPNSSNSQRTNTEIRNRWNNTLKQDIIDRIYYTRTINIARTPQTMHTNIPTDPTNDDIQQFIYDMKKMKQQRPPPPLTLSSSKNADGGYELGELIRRKYKCDRTVIETFVKLLGGTIQWDDDDDDDDDDKKKNTSSNSNRKNIDGEDNCNGNGVDARTFTAKQPPQVQQEPQQRQQQFISSGMISSNDEIMATVKNENISNTKDGSDDVDGGVESDGDDLVF